MAEFTHRMQCEAAVERAYARHTAEIDVGDAAGIGRRMQLQVSAALLCGVADMLDREVAHEEIWPQVARAAGGGLASYLMFAVAGNANCARVMVPGAAVSVWESAIARLSDPSEWSGAFEGTTGQAGTA